MSYKFPKLVNFHASNSQLMNQNDVITATLSWSITGQTIFEDFYSFLVESPFRSYLWRSSQCGTRYLSTCYIQYDCTVLYLVVSTRTVRVMYCVCGVLGTNNQCPYVFKKNSCTYQLKVHLQCRFVVSLPTPLPPHASIHN